jgi:hydroxylamine dehydrogenase
LCIQCRTLALIDRVYSEAEKVVASTNDKVQAAANNVTALRNDRILTVVPFTEPIDFICFDLWYTGATLFGRVLSAPPMAPLLFPNLVALG